MKAMILSITTGHGHHAAANSIAETFKKRGATVKIIDVYKQLDKNFSDAINKGYLLSMKHAPNAYRALYELVDSKTEPATKYAPRNIANFLLSIRFEKFIEEFNPDVIICTHVFAAHVINELKRRNKLSDIPTIGVVTDYTIHPFWEDVTNIEFIEIPSELLTPRAKMKSISEKRLLPFGIPIQKKFFEKTEKSEARKRLEIPEDSKVILLMAGSMGYANMPETINGIMNFDSSCTVLAVCGNNKRLYNKLTASQKDNVKVFGFIDYVDLLMDAADCIVTKPGGLTISESVAKNLPMIFVNPIPGQEDRNQEFFLNRGLAIAVSKTFTMEEAMHFLFNEPGRLDSIRLHLSKVSKPDPAEKIVEFSEKLMNE